MLRRSGDRPMGRDLMSAKLTTIVYIVVSFEVGILLLLLPWSVQFWEENFFLYLLADRLRAPWLPEVVGSGWIRGAVAGLGLSNVIIGIRESLHFVEQRRRARGEAEPLRPL
jgi:hypothetical protein